MHFTQKGVPVTFMFQHILSLLSGNVHKNAWNVHEVSDHVYMEHAWNSSDIYKVVEARCHK